MNPRLPRSFLPCLFVLSLLLFVAGCERPTAAGGPFVDDPALVDELLAADRVFAAAAAERGVEGWLDAFAIDAVRLLPGSPPLRGREEFGEIDAGLFADPNLRLEWEPDHAGTFEGGRLGFTTGSYRLVDRTTVDAVVLSSGTYLTLWRKDDSQWMAILDTGTAVSP